MILLTKLLRQRRVVCANFILADSHLAFDQQDVFTANQVVHLKPLIGEEMMFDVLAANPFVSRCYPNAGLPPRTPLVDVRSRPCRVAKELLELALQLPSPIIEAVCRRLYAWHLGRRAASWRSPEQVLLRSDYLKLHTQSHRHSVLDRFDAAVDRAIERAARAVTRPAAAGGRR